MKKNNAEVAYSRFMDLHTEYMEMVHFLMQVKQVAEAAQQGVEVDWTHVVTQIDALKAFQPEK